MDALLSFRPRRPAGVRAGRWQPGSVALSTSLGVELTTDDPDQPGAFIRGRRGEVFLSPGDWVVTTADGARTVVPDDAFQLLFVAENGP